MTAATPHYFVFRPHLGASLRPCGECGLSYDAGEHIEITVLKPYTNYVCPVGNGELGHSAHWTGAYHPELRRLTDGRCACGAQFEAEDKERWLLSWEMDTYRSGEWRPIEKVASRHAAHAQKAGLEDLIAQGEPIRNVRLTQLVEARS